MLTITTYIEYPRRWSDSPLHCRPPIRLLPVMGVDSTRWMVECTMSVTRIPTALAAFSLSLQARGSTPVDEDEDEDVCAECGEAGELLMCDSCPLVYHLSCLDPPLSAVPEGSWLCPKCVRGVRTSAADSAAPCRARSTLSRMLTSPKCVTVVSTRVCLTRVFQGLGQPSSHCLVGCRRDLRSRPSCHLRTNARTALLQYSIALRHRLEVF